MSLLALLSVLTLLPIFMGDTLQARAGVRVRVTLLPIFMGDTLQVRVGVRVRVTLLPIFMGDTLQALAPLPLTPAPNP